MKVLRNRMTLCQDMQYSFSECAFALGGIMCRPSGKLLISLSPEISDDILHNLKKYMNDYGVIKEYTKGSLIANIRFHSLLKLTSFWMKLLDGSLERDLLKILTPSAIREQYDLADLKLNMEFSLNDYVAAAYELILHPRNYLNNQGECKQHNTYVTTKVSVNSIIQCTPYNHSISR